MSNASDNNNESRADSDELDIDAYGRPAVGVASPTLPAEASGSGAAAEACGSGSAAGVRGISDGRKEADESSRAGSEEADEDDEELSTRYVSLSKSLASPIDSRAWSARARAGADRSSSMPSSRWNDTRLELLRSGA